MKKILSLIFMIMMFAVPCVSSPFIGLPDKILSISELPNSSDGLEGDFISIFLSDTEMIKFRKYENIIWTNFDDGSYLTDIWFWKFPVYFPEIYLVKFGNLDPAGEINDRHILYDNLFSGEYAVIDLNSICFLELDIDKISHVSFYEPEPAPVPEPTTLLLFGCGLFFISGIARFRQNK